MTLDGVLLYSAGTASKNVGLMFFTVSKERIDAWKSVVKKTQIRFFKTVVRGVAQDPRLQTLDPKPKTPDPRSQTPV